MRRATAWAAGAWLACGAAAGPALAAGAGRSGSDGEAARARTLAAAWRTAWEELAHDPAFAAARCLDSTAEIPALGGDRIAHRALTRDDFRAPRESQHLTTVVRPMAGTRTLAHVATSLVCIGRLRAEEVARDRFEVAFEDVRYQALLDREGSWWSPQPQPHPEWVLRHEQLHFDITELVARRYDARSAFDAERTKFVATTPGAALRGFAERWAAHMEAVRAEEAKLQERYDRETRHGQVPPAQTAWLLRVHRELAGLPAAAP